MGERSESYGRDDFGAIVIFRPNFIILIIIIMLGCNFVVTNEYDDGHVYEDRRAYQSPWSRMVRLQQGSRGPSC